MPDPVTFSVTTPIARLPLLVAGQAQKEFFINEALSILDALLPRAITASQAAPPSSPAEGDCFRVTAPATGAWSGHADSIAALVAGDWHFIDPVQGMAVFDRAADHLLVFRSGWKMARAPAQTSAGTVVDTEARAAIAALIEALCAVGILATADP